MCFIIILYVTSGIIINLSIYLKKKIIIILKHSSREKSKVSGPGSRCIFCSFLIIVQASAKPQWFNKWSKVIFCLFVC